MIRAIYSPIPLILRTQQNSCALPAMARVAKAESSAENSKRREKVVAPTARPVQTSIASSRRQEQAHRVCSGRPQRQRQNNTLERTARTTAENPTDQCRSHYRLHSAARCCEGSTKMDELKPTPTSSSPCAPRVILSYYCSSA